MTIEKRILNKSTVFYFYSKIFASVEKINVEFSVLARKKYGINTR